MKRQLRKQEPRTLTPVQKLAQATRNWKMARAANRQLCAAILRAVEERDAALMTIEMLDRRAKAVVAK